MLHVLGLLYFMAPAYAANMAAPLTRYWKGWNRPISAPWLGTHKTVVGFAAGVLAALATSLAQSVIGHDVRVADGTHWIQLGLCFGIGAMAGDALKSFFKRRRGIPPGQPWLPFDQIDFVLGALVLVIPRSTLTLADVVVVLLLSFVGHIGVNHAAYWLGIRDVKW